MQYLFLISWFVNTASPTRLHCLVRQQSRACGATKRQRAARLRLAIKPGKWCQEISCEAYASKIARVDACARCVYAWACTRCVWRDIHLVTLQKCRTAGLMYIIMKRRNLITSVCKQCCYHSSTAHGERDFLLINEFSLCVTDEAAIDYQLCSCWFFFLDWSLINQLNKKNSSDKIKFSVTCYTFIVVWSFYKVPMNVGDNRMINSKSASGTFWILLNQYINLAINRKILTSNNQYKS